MPEDRVGAAEIVAGKLVSNRSDGGAVMTRTRMVYTLVGLLLDVVMMEAEYAKLRCESVLQYSNTPR